jgi:hypothetical protein
MGAVLLVVDSFSPQKASPGETKGVADG